MDNRERYLTFVEVLSELVEHCEEAQESRACKDCPFYEDHSKCLKWEENMDDLSANDIYEFLDEFDAEVYETDMSFSDYDDELGEEF